MRGPPILPSLVTTEPLLIFVEQSCERDRQVYRANVKGPAQVVAEYQKIPFLPLAAARIAAGTGSPGPIKDPS